MLSFGVLLVILGVGSLVLPYLGLQFTLMDWLEDYQPWAGVIVAAVGLITILYAARRRPTTVQSTVVTDAPPPPSSPPPSDVE